MTALALDRRRGRQQAGRQGRPVTLNLVSLMDIFTILVFFLMVNSSDVQVLETSPAMQLPDSSSDQRPGQQVVIRVSAGDVLLQQDAVAAVAALQAGDTQAVARLVAGLAALATALPADQLAEDVPVTILGDRDLPYALVKQLVAACQSSPFARVALAVNQVPVVAPLAGGAE